MRETLLMEQSVLQGDKLGEVGKVDLLVPFLNNGQPLEEEL